MLISYLRTLLIYLVLVAGVRVLGKRQVGQMEPSEFVVTMLIANLAAVPMQDSAIPLMSGLVPILVILGAELLLSGLILKSLLLRRLFCGKPVVLIDNGKILTKHLRATRVTLDELTSQLRIQGILTLTEVQYAILETDGNLSVFPWPKDRPATAREAGIQAEKQRLPITILADGKLLRENLHLAGKSEEWLRRVLESKGARRRDVLLLTVDSADHLFFLEKGDLI